MSTNSIAPDHLRAFIERVETIEAQVKQLGEDKKDVYAEAKGNGYDVKIIAKIVSIRKQDPDTRREEEEILELYLRAMNMQA